MEVFVIAYNQSDYIIQAVDSILLQKTSFDFLIRIYDDSSTDDTFVNVRDKYGSLNNVELIRNEINMGPTHNLNKLVKTCKSKYFTILEGDNYWSDENKLQTQIDFLESHPSIVAVSHYVDYLKQDG